MQWYNLGSVQGLQGLQERNSAVEALLALPLLRELHVPTGHRSSMSPLKEGPSTFSELMVNSIDHLSIHYETVHGATVYF